MLTDFPWHLIWYFVQDKEWYLFLQDNVELLWSHDIDNEFVEVRRNRTEAYWKTDELQTIKTNIPISRGIQEEFYFEVLVIDSGKEDIVTVGVCRENYPVDLYPGYGNLSIGYHGDDGGIFVEKNDGISYETNEKYTAGNHIGVLLDYYTETLTFSKDKMDVHQVKLEPHFMNEDLYPCVGFEDTIGNIAGLVTAKQGLYV